jgi:dienelactone hydrolase
MTQIRTLLAALALAAVAADFKDVDPGVFPSDDPRAKDLAKMMAADARARTQEANLRESKAFAAVGTKAQWEAYRDARTAALRASLGTFPEAPKDVRVQVTRELAGDGYRIHNVLYESRPGVWVSANLYLPAKPVAKMPGILISTAHHTAKTNGELQDMGMTWARAGAAVLVPDAFGYGERRQHDFRTDKDFDKPFRAGRQDYYFRYNSNLQLSAIGDSLMGWMAWDLMRGVDVLLKQPGIDRERIILLGAVAGGGDPAGVTAALDPRVACVAPFNFGGWQPESSVLENPDRDFAWFGDAYWESTRGLRYGARDGFAHYAIVGSVAPRKVIYGHEFAWSAEGDPAWPRLQKVFGFYDARAGIAPVHGKGSVKGPGGPENTHCTHIGPVHRAGIYPLLKEWFAMPVPAEYSQRRTSDELLCWTDEARAELKPRPVREVIAELAVQRRTAALAKLPADAAERREALRKLWAGALGDVEPLANPKVVAGVTDDVPGGTLARFALETDAGITVPVLLVTPKDTKGPVPVVVVVSQAGKRAYLKERRDVVAALLKSGIAVCLVDVRGTGETRPGDGAGRGSSRTSVSQANLILGQPVLGAQLRDLRTVTRWLAARDGIDGSRLAVWGDSFAKVNPPDAKLAVPLDADGPAISEPCGANLALLLGLFEDGVVAVHARGGLDPAETFSGSAYLYVPHDAIVPSPVQVATLAPLLGKPVSYDAPLDAQNRPTSDKAMSPAAAAAWVAEKLRGK